jgi:rubrerythrin
MEQSNYYSTIDRAMKKIENEMMQIDDPFEDENGDTLFTCTSCDEKYLLSEDTDTCPVCLEKTLERSE